MSMSTDADYSLTWKKSVDVVEKPMMKKVVEMEREYDESMNWNFSIQEQIPVSNLRQLAMFLLHLDEQTIDYLDWLQQSVRILLFERKFHLL